VKNEAYGSQQNTHTESKKKQIKNFEQTIMGGSLQKAS
jgi:hypothetical protein